MSAPSNALYGYASPVTQTTLEKTVLLAERLGQTPILVRSLVALFGTRFVQGNIDQSYEVADRALALAGSDAELAAQAHFGFAGSVLSLGYPATAAEHFDLAIELSPANASLLVGTRLDVHSQGWSAHAHWLLGDEDGAAARAADALSRARAADHPYSVAVALAYAAITAQLCGNPDALAAAIAELDGLCRRYEFAYYGEWALILEGWSVGEVGVSRVRDGISRLRSLGSFARMPYWLCLLSSTLDAAGRRDEAAAVLDGATVDAQQRNERWWLPEVLRCRAALEEGPAADSLLRRACGVAREQGSQALKSRCLADLPTMERSGPPGPLISEPNARRTLPSRVLRKEPPTRRRPDEGGHRGPDKHYRRQSARSRPVRQALSKPGTAARDPRGPRVRRGPSRLQRNDRSPACRPGLCQGSSDVAAASASPPSTGSTWPSVGAATAAGSASGTTPSSWICLRSAK